MCFLVEFGANIFALDNTNRSAKEAAALGGHQHVLLYLDGALEQRRVKDPMVGPWDEQNDVTDGKKLKKKI